MLLSLRKTVTLRLTHTPILAEMGVYYAIPLAGKNTVVNRAINLKTSVSSKIFSGEIIVCDAVDPHWDR